MSLVKKKIKYCLTHILLPICFFNYLIGNSKTQLSIKLDQDNKRVL